MSTFRKNTTNLTMDKGAMDKGINTWTGYSEFNTFDITAQAPSSALVSAFCKWIGWRCASPCC